MEIIEWKKILLPYTYAVEELKTKFKNYRKELQSKGEYSPVEFVTGRVKKINSIIDKAQRLHIDIEKIEEMEDIAGIRIMCQMVKDIYTMAEHIRNRKDMRVLYEKDYVANFKESGYRSYHLIVSYPIQTSAGYIEISAEIQIRTLAMNFWATIEHSLRYKYNNYVPEEIAQRLKRAADAAFNLDQEMMSIYSEIVSAQMAFEFKSLTINDITQNIDRLQRLGYEKEALLFQNRVDLLVGNSGIDELVAIQERIARLVEKASQKKLKQESLENSSHPIDPLTQAEEVE